MPSWFISLAVGAVIPALSACCATAWAWGAKASSSGQVRMSLPRILAEPDADPLAVLRGGIEQQRLDVAGVRPLANHIEEPVAPILIAAELDADGPIRVVERGLLGRGEIPTADNIEIRRDLVDDGAPFPLEIEPRRRPDLPIALQQPLALEQRQRQQPGEIIRVDPQQGGVVEHLRRDEGDADRPRRVNARRKILRQRHVSPQVFRLIGPDDVIRDSDIIAQNADPLGDRKPGFRVDPPCQELGDPTVRLRVAGRPDIGLDAAGRAVAADHVEKLMRGEMRQLVEADQGDLSALPVMNGGFELQMRKLDLAAIWPAPLVHPEVRDTPEPRIEVQALIP